MAFADSVNRRVFSLPFYRFKLIVGREERTVDLEAYLITSVKPEHICLLAEPPRGGSSAPPKGAVAARPELSPRSHLDYVASQVKRLEELAYGRREPVKISVSNILTRLFLGGRPGRVSMPSLEYRLAYSLCTDIFGDPPFSSLRFIGASTVWRGYKIELSGEELRVFNLETGATEKRLIKILGESDEAREKLFKLVGW